MPVSAAEGWAADAGGAAHVFVDDLAARVELAGEDAHHLTRVLRLRPGEVVTAADGTGRWRPYVLRGGPALEASGPVRLEPRLPPSLAVAFALTKADKPELVVQKLTELGIDRILPVRSERSVARPDPARARSQAQRWRRVAVQAARQCRRARLPEVGDLVPLTGLAGHAGLVLAERGGAALGGLAWPPEPEILVVIGPEGGLSAEEVDALQPRARVDLGPLVLRAETAAVAAAAVLCALRAGGTWAANASVRQRE